MRVSNRRARTLLAGVATVLPGRLRRAVHTGLLGHDIHPTAKLGLAFVDVDRLVMGPRATIGHLNVIRGLEEVRMDEAAIILQLNWVNAVRRGKGFFDGVDRRPALVMGYSARILVMHFIDCCDLVEFEPKASLAGYWSMIMTHTFDHRTNKQGTLPIRIGDNSLVATRSTLLPGSVIPDRCLVAAGSTVTGELRGTGTLFGGTPAKKIADLDESAAFFTEQPEVIR